MKAGNRRILDTQRSGDSRAAARTLAPPYVVRLRLDLGDRTATDSEKPTSSDSLPESLKAAKVIQQ